MLQKSINVTDICVLYYSPLEIDKAWVISSEYKTDQANFTDSISFLSPNYKEEIQT